MTQEQAKYVKFLQKRGVKLGGIGFYFKYKYNYYPFVESFLKIEVCYFEENGKKLVEEALLIT